MKKLMIIWAVIAIFLVGVLTFIGFRYKESIADYKTLEMDMVESAHVYMELNDLSLDAGESLKLTSSQLIEQELLKEDAIMDENCSGYVMIEKNLTDYDYSAYIKCDNYETQGYEE